MNWTTPAGPEQGGREDPDGEMPAAALGAYLRGMLRHRLLFAAIVLTCLLSAAAWLSRGNPSYEARASILVSAIPAADQTLVGLPLIRGGDLEPERATQTAASLIGTPDSAEAGAQILGSPAALPALQAVTVTPRPNTSIVDVTASAGSAEEAANIANAYARGALRARKAALEPEVEALIAQTEADLATVPPNGSTAETLRAKLANLRSVAARGDPTLSIAAAAKPGELQGRSTRTVLILALIAGLTLAGLTIVLIELLSPRPIEDENELSVAYPLPVLSRVRLADFGDDLTRPLTEAPEGLREGFRALRSQLELRATNRTRENGGGGVVLLVSPGASEGHASCSLNLARAFVSVRESVTVIELDLRNPRMAGMLGMDPRYDVAELLRGQPVERVADRLDGEGLRLVAAPAAIDLETREKVISRSAEIVDASRRLSDWIVVDVAPMSEAADALIAAPSADHIVVVVRLGATNAAALGFMRELFEQTGRVPDGYLVVSGSEERGVRMRRRRGSEQQGARGRRGRDSAG
jgi:Mrp family chromosome partitioning ATPase/capsular polysaccharide biosynthesis protein